MLQNAAAETLSVRQIAHHLGTAPWNITHELSQGAQGRPGRLRGVKVTGPGARGAGGQWRVARSVYLDWLGVPAQDRSTLGDDGLPLLYNESSAAHLLGMESAEVRAALLRLGVAHLMVGWRCYLTHTQMQRLRVLLEEGHRERSR